MKGGTLPQSRAAAIWPLLTARSAATAGMVTTSARVISMGTFSEKMGTRSSFRECAQPVQQPQHADGVGQRADQPGESGRQ